MKKLSLILFLLLFSGFLYASYIFNPGAGSSSFLTDANGCVWQVGNTVSTGGVVPTTLISCPQRGRPCTSGMPLGLLMAITCP